MIFTCITLCCFILNAQSQNLDGGDPVYKQYRDLNHVYFPDNLPQGISLSDPVYIEEDILKRISQRVQIPQKNNNAIEVEKSNEIAFGTVEQASNTGKRSAVTRPAPLNTETIPSKQTAEEKLRQQQTVAQTSLTPIVPNRSVFNNLLYSVVNFGINLMKNINAAQSGNVVLSPYSITSLLALLQQGARGQTQEQITAALQMTPATAASSYSQVSLDFKSRNSRNILKTANSVFIADGFSLNKDFKKVAQNSFNSDITAVNYATPEAAAQKINGWVALKTNHNIEKLVSPDALDGTTQVVLVNAIYFKGLWNIPFRVEFTAQRDFQLSNGQTKKVPFMRSRKYFRTGTDPTTDAKIISLPFEGEQYLLMVILPSELVGMTRTLSSLSDARLLSYLTFPALETELELPKFTARSDIDLTAVFTNMGVTNIFGAYSELNGIGSYRTFSPQISSAVHSAVLSIDEQGGSAAAATAFTAVALSYDEPSVIFKANRPFIAVLWDNSTSLPLFMAKIEDPQQ